MSITRNSRYQEGSLERVARAKGPDVWVYRWRAVNADGRRVQRKRVIGAIDRYPSEAAAKRAVEQLRIEINADQERIGKLTVLEAWEHFQAKELHDPDVDRSPTTIALYLINFKTHIIPQWGATFLTDVKAVQVESWLRRLKLAPSTKSKLKNHLSALFSHAIRHELFDRINPMGSVRQSSKRVKIPDILSIHECGQILSGITDPAVRVAVLIASMTACRRSEIRGLKWSDVDFDPPFMHLKRGKVQRLETKLKTEASRRGLPIMQQLADVLFDLRSESLYRADDDWVFASSASGGREPFWFDVALKNHIRPAALAANITKRIGWTTFRRSVASALADAGEPVKVISDLLRHATVSNCLNLYSQASADSKRAAQGHFSELFNS